MRINELIRLKRKERNMTQKELADLLFVSSKTISKWETGRGLPELASITKISKELEISSDEIMGSINESSEVDKVGMDPGIQNAIIISGIIMLFSLVLFGIASYSLYRNENFLIYYLISSVLFIVSIGSYFILENNRSLKIGFRRIDSVNSDRKSIFKIWTFMMLFIPITQYFTYMGVTFEIWEIIIIISIEYLLGITFMYMFYKLCVKK